MNNSSLLHVSWYRWECLEGRLVCSTSRTRQFWSCLREHNLIDCVCQILLLFSLLCQSEAAALGETKTLHHLFPSVKQGSYWYTSPQEVICFVPLMKDAVKVWSICVSNCLRSCPITVKNGTIITHWLKAEYLVWNRSLYSMIPRERSGTKIYREVLQKENNKTPVYQSSLRPLLLLCWSTKLFS